MVEVRRGRHGGRPRPPFVLERRRHVRARGVDLARVQRFRPGRRDVQGWRARRPPDARASSASPSRGRFERGRPSPPPRRRRAPAPRRAAGRAARAARPGRARPPRELDASGGHEHPPRPSTSSRRERPRRRPPQGGARLHVTLLEADECQPQDGLARHRRGPEPRSTLTRLGDSRTRPPRGLRRAGRRHRERRSCTPCSPCHRRSGSVRAPRAGSGGRRRAAPRASIHHTEVAHDHGLSVLVSRRHEGRHGLIEQGARGCVVTLVVEDG